LLKAVWWGMRLASLLTHLFRCFSTVVVNKDEYIRSQRKKMTKE